MPQNLFSVFVARLAGTATQKQLTVDASGALIINSATPGNSVASKAGAIGYAANQTGATLSAGLATTYVGLCLSNPAASPVNLVVLGVMGNINVAPAALTSFGLISGFAAGGITVHTTPVTPQNGLIGAAAPVLHGLVDAACTLVGTPVWQDWFAETPAATSVTSFSKAYNGNLTIPPGGYLAIGASIAGPAAGLLGAFSWQEIPV